MRKGETVMFWQEIERLSGVPRADRRFPLEVQKNVEAIDKTLREIGHEWMVVSRNDDVVILSDRDAMKEATSLRESGARKIRKAARKLSGVDSSAVDSTELDREIGIACNMREAVRRARRRVKIAT